MGWSGVPAAAVLAAALALAALPAAASGGVVVVSESGPPVPLREPAAAVSWSGYTVNLYYYSFASGAPYSLHEHSPIGVSYELWEACGAPAPEEVAGAVEEARRALSGLAEELGGVVLACPALGFVALGVPPGHDLAAVASEVEAAIAPIEALLAEAGVEVVVYQASGPCRGDFADVQALARELEARGVPLIGFYIVPPHCRPLLVVKTPAYDEIAWRSAPEAAAVLEEVGVKVAEALAAAGFPVATVDVEVTNFNVTFKRPVLEAPAAPEPPAEAQAREGGDSPAAAPKASEPQAPATGAPAVPSNPAIAEEAARGQLAPPAERPVAEEQAPEATSAASHSYHAALIAAATAGIAAAVLRRPGR